MSIFVIMLLIRGGNAVNLVYSDEHRARKDFHALNEAIESKAPLDIELHDDFGTEAHININDIAVRTLQNVQKVQEANGEMQLVNMRTNVKLQTKARNDPVLKFAAAGMGPGVLS